MDEPQDTRAEGGAGEHGTPEVPDRARARDPRTGRAAAAARIQQQTSWVDLQVRQATARGDFDDLPGLGRPIDGLGEEHDPDWWVKKLVDREQVSVLPPALAIRNEDAELDDLLDSLSAEREVRRELEEFNARVRSARIQPLGGPPMITPERDVEAGVEAWRERRDARRAAAAERAARGGADGSRPTGSSGRLRRWLRLRPDG